MASFSKILTSLTGFGFYYEKNPRHATYNFNQDARSLYRNHPRLPFEYYIDIKLNNVGTAGDYIAKYFNNPTWAQITPLVKTVEMPNFKIDTKIQNQYNRKRISQEKITFDPIKMVFHDVADGKTLKFWEMYYRYYFGDGSEPGKNEPKDPNQSKKPISVEEFLRNITPQVNPAITSLPQSIRNIWNRGSPARAVPRNTDGDKSSLDDIYSQSLNNHWFGFNLPAVQNIRYLIQQIDIYQVHGGRFNKVTLVNPRISRFQHDTLNYAEGSKTLELTFEFEYEYAYYTIQNMKLGGTENNNGSSLSFFENGEFLELPALAFNAVLNDFIESNNPLLESDNPILRRVGKNVQSSIGNTTGAFLSDKVARPVSASALDGLAQIRPRPYTPPPPTRTVSRPFVSTAAPTTTMYRDVNRIGGNPGGGP